MKLVPADFVSEEDHAIQCVLDAHPVLKWHLALLVNMYRELTTMALEAMQRGETDSADGWISLAKKDTLAGHYGIPLFDGLKDWAEARRELDKARDNNEEKEG